ncbi:MAG: Gfo/Idh/MocA family oxidoreductase [Acetobacteraceae bacterium]
MTDKIAIGVIGTGMIGQEHIRRLTSAVAGGRIAAVADADPARARAVAATVPGARVHDSGEALIADPAVEAIVVTSWGPTHEAYVLGAIAAGKPVFCEKPLATTQAACLRIIEAEVAFGRRLVQVGFMRRFDGAYRAMKEAITSGAIGAPLLFHSAHRNPSVPSHYVSDMALNDTAVHDIDIARFLLEDEVVAASVLKPRRNRRGETLDDPLLLLLEMAGGAIVDVETSVNIAYGYDIRGEVVGESGTVKLAERNPVVVKSAGRFAGEVPADWRARFHAAFDAEMLAWVAAAAQGTAAGPSSWDGYAATVVSDAALASLHQGGRVAVAMREKPALYRG